MRTLKGEKIAHDQFLFSVFGVLDLCEAVIDIIERITTRLGVDF